VSLEGYRFGYQGSEKDNEFKGEGNSYTTEFRQLDPRLGRWLSVDPVFQPWQSSYCSMDNNPIMLIDQLGLESQNWVKGSNNRIRWDSKIKTDEEAIAKYGEGASILKPGYKFSNNYGSYTLGENANYTLNGTNNVASDFANIEPTNLQTGKIISTPISDGYSGQKSDPLANVNLSSFEKGFSTPASLFSNPWRSDYDMNPEWEISRKKCNALEKAILLNLSIPIATIGGFEFGLMMFGQLSGEFGVAQQIDAWYRVGSTLADGIAQTIDISSNGGSWNWGSTIGNIAFDNPYFSAAPGTVYNMINDENLYNNINLHLSNYMLNVLGNEFSRKISKIDPNLMSNGFKHGLSGFTMPLMFSAGQTGINYQLNNKK